VAELPVGAVTLRPGRVALSLAELGRPAGVRALPVSRLAFAAGESAGSPPEGAGLAPGAGVSSAGAGLVAGGGVCVAVPAGALRARADLPDWVFADSPGRSTSSALTEPAPCSGVRRSWLQSW